MFNFNNEWSYDVETNFPTQRQKNYTQMRHKKKYDQNIIQEQMKRKNTQAKIKFSIQKQDNQLQLKINSKIFPKKKIFSNLQNKKLKNSYFENKINQKNSQPSIRLQNYHKDMQSEDLQKDLVVHSKKLVGIKLPQINQVHKKNQIIVKMNLSNLKMINIEERIKTLKYTPQKSEVQSSFSSSEIRFDNKVENKQKIYIKKQGSKPPKLHINQKQLIQHEKIISLQKQKHQEQKHKKSLFRIQKDKKHNMRQKTEVIKNQPQQINKLQKNISPEVQEQKSESFLPKIQVYDKKMKIGKKLKKQEDRIKAMLLKTLQKTKAIQYVAQCGSSQRNNSKQHSVNSHKRSISKNSKEGADQKSRIILIQEQSVQKNPHISLNKKLQMQNLKKSLKPIHQKQYSAQVKNKKFVQMVRQAENQKNQNINKKQLQEIKQQKTFINQQDSDNNQEHQKKRNNKNESYEKQEIIQNKVENESQELNNQFLNVEKLVPIK